MFVLENESIRVSIDAKSGTIRSLYDKKNSVERGLGRQINVLVEVGSRRVEKQGTSKVIEAERNDLYQRIVVKRTQPLAHTSEYILYHDSDAVEITNKIESGFSSTFKWKFDFDVKSPSIWHEEVGAILNAKLKSDGGHYASKNARYDWLSLGHFAAVAGTDGIVELANRDCAFFQVGDSTSRNLDSASSCISVLAGGQVDGRKLGIPKQFGQTRFTQRFAIRVGNKKLDTADTMRWSLEWQNPAVSVTQSNSQGSDSLPATESLLKVEGDKDVLLWAFKPAEEGIEKGVIARLWNLGEGGKVQLGVANLQSAESTTHIETALAPIGIVDGKTEPIVFGKQQMRTVRLRSK